MNINESFAKFLHDFYEGSLKLEPLTATYAGDNRFNHIFPNYISAEFKKEAQAFYQNNLEKLAEFDKSSLNETEVTSYEVLKWECEIALEGMAFSRELTPIDQMWSVNLTVGQLASGAAAQPFKTPQDYDNWLMRVDGYMAWCNTAIENMRKGMETGFVLPKVLIKKIIPQFVALSKGKVEDHLFYKPVNMIPADFSESDKLRIKSAYTKMVAEQIIPINKKLADFFENEYLAAGRDSHGFDAYSKGAEMYQHSIKKYTSTDLTADEIFELGLKEVARLRSEMEKVKEKIGFEGDLKSFFDFVRSNKQLMPFTEPQQIIDNYNEIHERMMPQLEKLFDKRPKSPFEVRRTEKFREASASAEYCLGSIDGTRPGVFYIPIPDASKHNVYSDEDLFLHEAIPGHHYQLSLQQENLNLPAFRKTLWYSAYGEGWALYCESLGEELGLYTDPYQYFGMLGAEMHRAIRLVVDPGLHTKGWTREKAIQYSIDNEAEPLETIESEIERYMANPGQALSYKIGQIRLLELRAYAEKELGAQFDVKKFHNMILEPGCIPLKVLENQVKQWVITSKTVTLA